MNLWQDCNRHQISGAKGWTEINGSFRFCGKKHLAPWSPWSTTRAQLLAVLIVSGCTIGQYRYNICWRLNLLWGKVNKHYTNDGYHLLPQQTVCFLFQNFFFFFLAKVSEELKALLSKFEILYWRLMHIIYAKDLDQWGCRSGNNHMTD